MQSVCLNSRSSAKLRAMLGTWQAKPGEVEHAVETALKAGYTHIDGAAIYRNEKEVGEGLKASGVDREKIWLTSKVGAANETRRMSRTNTEADFV